MFCCLLFIGYYDPTAGGAHFKPGLLATYPNEKLVKLSKRFSIPSIEHLSLLWVSPGILHYFAYATRTHPVKSLHYSNVHGMMGDTDGPIVIEILKACAGHLEAVSIRCE